MDKHSLYEKVRLFTEQFPYQYRDGVMEEIKEIFFQLQTEGKRGVKDFALFFDYQTNHYRVKVILEENNLASAQSIFLSFFGFVASAGATITARRETEQGMHYLFASFSEKGSGFCCEIDFLSEEADLPEEERQKDREGSLQEVGEPSSSQRPQPDVIWTFKMDAAAYFPPLAAQGIIYGVGNTGDLSAVDARQGTLRWRWQAQSQRHNITALSGVDQSMLAVSTSFRAQLNRSEATLSVLDSQTGRVLWSFPVPALQSIGFCPVLTLQDGIVYLSGTDRTGQPAGPHSLCLALDLQTGVQKWTADVGEYRGVTPPIVSDARVYLATFEVPRGHSFFGYLHALDAQTGREIWKHPFETRRIQESVVAGTEIFVAGTRFEVVDAATGMTQWSLPDVPSFRESALAVSDELVVISYERFPAGWGGPEIEKPHEVLLAGGPLCTGEVMAVERVSKQPRWVTRLTYGRSFPERSVIANGVLYTTWKHLDIRGGVTHATLFALDAQTGQERWRFEADDLSAPRVEDGIVFIRVQKNHHEYIYALS